MDDEGTAVAGWLGRQARSWSDVDAVRDVVGEAVVVGLGVPTNGAHELVTAVQEVFGTLVEHAGFRALAVDEEPRVTAPVDDHLRTGDGDLGALLADLWTHHRTEEVLAVLRWMRAWNQRHPADAVRLLGVGPGADEPVPSDRIAHAERRIPENLVRDHEETGAKVALWSGVTHTAVGDARTVSIASVGSATHRNAGSRLRSRFGEGYVSVGLTFHHGEVDPGPGPVPVPAPAADFVEATLATAGADRFLLDLRAEHPRPVGDWLRAPAKLRLVGPWYDPAHDTGFHMTGGCLAEWFDAVAFVERVSPTRAVA